MTEKKRVQVTLALDVIDRLEELAKTMGLSKSNVITTLINSEFDKERAKKA